MGHGARSAPQVSAPPTRPNAPLPPGTQVITQTLRPLLAPHACPDLPPAVIPRLIDRFRSREAYTLAPGVPALLRALRGLRRRGQRPAVVAGVVSNSDARVPAVLASLGVRVGAAARGSGGEADLAFVVSSYDVGVEKPGAGIFVAAEREGEEEGGWGRRVYVGDEYGKDVCGAVGAGWDAVLVDSEAREERVRWRGGEDDRGETLEEVFQGGNAVGARSLDVVARWLDQGGGG